MDSARLGYVFSYAEALKLNQDKVHRSCWYLYRFLNNKILFGFLHLIRANCCLIEGNNLSLNS